MNRFHALIIILTSALIGVGCSSEDPRPEQRDPIFKDLSGRQAAHAQALKEGEKQMTELKKDLDRAEPHSLELKNAARDIADMQRRMLREEELERFYRIRAERRRLVGRQEYKRAFAEGKEWPDPSEYSDYLLNIRLRTVDLNWSSRVPRLQERLPSARTPANEQKNSPEAAE